MTFLLYLTSICFISLSLVQMVTAPIQQTSIRYRKNFENVKLQSLFDVLSMTNVSLAKCAARCTSTEDCFSFVHNSVNKQCKLSDIYLPRLQTFVIPPSVDNGSNVYYAEGKDLPSCLNCTLPSCQNYTQSVSLATESEQVITSPNYPGKYSERVNQYLLIVKPASASTLKMTFTTMDLEKVDDCRYDSVSLFSGRCTSDRLILKLCGDTLKSFDDSSSSNVLLWFHSDHSRSGTGFSMTYYV